MNKSTSRVGLFLGVCAATLLAANMALAEVSAETKFVFNTFSFLVHGFLVMFMAAGFAMLESGLVRTKNTAAICLKNISLYSVAGIMYYLIGYNLMYVDVAGWIGKFALLYNPSADELALINADPATPEMVTKVIEGGYSVMSDWFFQMVFVATAASICSGTLAERIKLWPFFAFVFFLTALVYPIQGAWIWGSGQVAQMASMKGSGSMRISPSFRSPATRRKASIISPTVTRRLGKLTARSSPRAAPSASYNRIKPSTMAR